jgi:hypothetical protein
MEVLGKLVNEAVGRALTLNGPTVVVVVPLGHGLFAVMVMV